MKVIKENEVMKTTFIYLLLDPEDKSPKYIGKAYNPVKRFKSHITKKVYTDKGRWLLALDSIPLLEILDEVPREEENFWEKYYISLYRTWGFKLTNMTDGGDGGATRTGCKQTIEEIIKRVTTRRKNGKPWVSIEQKEIMRENAKGNKNRKGKKCTEEQKQQMSIIKKSLVNDEFRERMRKSSLGNQNRRGKKAKQTTIDKLGTPVVQLNMTGVEVKEWSSISQAVRETSIGGIANCLTGRSKSAGGFLWKYKLA